ncbi:hypothetical protein [Planctomyces sp. SH-PL14]|uniref:hypothetical protein n=1 Tax=Planctomyces sp. SH-PL14 TaxID=1632864 RepID=UPI00078DC01A|nr:hypothetical protein [Planctomyces sp. SH-PL14]AMV20435.1 hypothetical protein VT03_21230 [Planctomyces sp. SH-PL14]
METWWLRRGYEVVEVSVVRATRDFVYHPDGRKSRKRHVCYSYHKTCDAARAQAIEEAELDLVAIKEDYETEQRKIRAAIKRLKEPTQ